MPLNFPDSPNNGDTYQGYTYNSTVGAWAPAAADTSGVTVYATVDDLPATGTAGDQAFVTASNRLYLWNGSGWYNIALINTTPSISGAASSYALATDGSPTTVTITATDPEGLPITYSIASDTSGNIATVTSNNNVFTITPSTNTANAGTFSLTFRASDGVNIASAVSSFTLQFSVQNQNYTTALITSVGDNNAVNNSFDDKSSNDYSMTVNGDSHQTTFSPYRHAGYSTYFDGTGDNLTTSSAILSTTGGFTVQCWVYLDDTSNAAIWAQGTSGNAARASLSIESGNWYAQIGSAVINTTAAVANVWKFLEFQYDGSQIELFVDGSSVGTASNTTNAENTGLFIGKLWAGGYDLQGYVTDFRVINGTPSGTSAIPTGRLTAVTNTSLLTCHLPYIADGSTNDHTITINGDTSTKPFTPYDAQEYAVVDHLGSAYFDGNGDSLNFTTTGDLQAMGRSGSACTVEAWVYLYSVSGNGTGIFAQGTAGSTAGSNIIEFGIKPDRRVRGLVNGSYVNENGSPVSTGTVPFQIWTHLAWVLHNQTWTIYINGKADGTATGTYPSGTTHNAGWIGRNHYDANRTGEANIADLRINATEALYTSNFTPPASPVSTTANTVLHMPMSDAGIIDKSQSVKSLTLAGDTKSSTTQTKYLTSSMYFDEAGDTLTMTSHKPFFGSGDWTFEGWFYFTSVNKSDWQYIFDGRNNGSNYFAQESNNAWRWNSGSGAAIATGLTSSTFSNNTWYHLAVARESGTLRVFVDGTYTGGGADSSAYGTTNLVIAGRYASPPNNFGMYVQDLRFTNGLARYTANFTPPTAALQG